MQQVLLCIESNEVLRCTVLCEPQLGKRGLYPTISTKKSAEIVRDMMNIIAYSDGNNTTMDIANIMGSYLLDILPIINRLKDEKILATL